MSEGEKQGILDIIEIQTDHFELLAEEKKVISIEYVIEQFKILKRVVESK